MQSELMGDRQMLVVMAALATPPGEDHTCILLEHSACTMLCANQLLG